MCPVDANDFILLFLCLKKKKGLSAPTSQPQSEPGALQGLGSPPLGPSPCPFGTRAMPTVLAVAVCVSPGPAALLLCPKPGRRDSL